MKLRRLYLITILFFTTGLFVWWGRRGEDHQLNNAVAYASDLDSGKASLRSTRDSFDVPLTSGASDEAHLGRALSTAPADVKGLPDDNGDANLLARAISSDDAILAAGGLGGVKAKVAAVSEELRKARLKSIMAKDWEGQGNLLVNELRAGKGFEVEFATVETFLRGKDLFGWPEGQRNWIGDEMMTMLRQEMPAKAYELIRDIQADVTAPDAMRDYSIQHISHLIADGAVGQEGVALIRAALESNNPVLASTALMSLHRLSEKSPVFIKPEKVKDYAQRYESSHDGRLKISAAAILKEARE